MEVLIGRIVALSSGSLDNKFDSRYTRKYDANSELFFLCISRLCSADNA